MDKGCPVWSDSEHLCGSTPRGLYLRRECREDAGVVKTVRPRYFSTLMAAAVLVAVAAGGPVTGAPEMPRLGGVYVKPNVYSEPLSMDPLFALGASTIMLQMNIFDGLVRVDPIRKSVVPDVAERWTHSPDAKTFTFYLRKGVRFHDGSEVTAADFKYQFERVANPANLSPHMARLAGVVGLKAFQEKRTAEITGIAVVDKYTLRITMEGSNLLLPYYLAGTWASAVPRRVVEERGKDFGVRPVGSGPFVLESWIRGQEIVLRKFPNYWRKDQWGNQLPYLERVVFRPIRDTTAVQAELEAGRIDSAWILGAAYDYSPEKAMRLLAEAGYPKGFGVKILTVDIPIQVAVVEAVAGYTTYIGFNFDLPGVPWRDKRVRQAVNHAIDRRAVVDVVLHGMAYPAVGGPLPLMFPEAQRASGYGYDPEKARKLLAEAGYPNGFSARILTRSSPHYVAMTEAVMGFLGAVGIRLQPEVLDTTAARAARDQDGKFELSLSALGGEGHPLIFLQRGFHSRFAGPAGNTTRYRNPTVDQLLDRAAAARDTNTMLRLVRDAERIVVDEAPWSSILHLKGVMVKQPYVRGLRPVAIDMDWQPLEEVWLAWEPTRR